MVAQPPFYRVVWGEPDNVDILYIYLMFLFITITPCLNRNVTNWTENSDPKIVI